MQPKVLFISSWYPNPLNKTHGIFVKRYAEAVALYNEIAVIHIFGDESLKEDFTILSKTENKVFEVLVSYKKKKADPFSKLNRYKHLYLKGLDHLLKEWGRPDILQVNVAFPAGIAGMMISEKLNVPYIVSEHWTGYLPEDGSYNGFIKRFLTRKIVRHASRLVTVTGDLKNKMISHKLKGNYHVVPNVVNTDVFKYQISPIKPRFRFLHVSSLDQRQKNVEGIINAFKKVYKENPLTELYIVGNGENRKHLEELCGQSLNRSVFFLGQKFDSTLAEEFCEADALVMFSNYENLPVVILEALCCGLPVLSSNVGGISEYITDSNGLLIKPKDEAALIESMIKISKENKKYDRKKISLSSQEIFNFNNIGKRFSKIYTEVLQ
jgi:glycosyltransferase involved in cell wall biosynthesis